LRETVLPYLCCPVDRTPLSLSAETRDSGSDQIISGTLTSTQGRAYAIVEGIPHLTLPYRTAAEAATVGAFGREWARYDDFEGTMGSAELFSEFTGLDEGQIRGRAVLEVGCGGGRWLKVLAQLGAREVVGLEFSTAAEQAYRRTANLPNVHVVRGSALEMPLQPRFDLLISVGVIHHLADPVLGLTNMRLASAVNHLVVIWVYAREGNEAYLSLVGPLRKLTRRAPDWLLAPGSRLLSAVLWSYIHTVNRAAVATRLRLPLRDYLGMLARLRFRDIESVVYDQLAPQIARYPTRSEVLDWVSRAGGAVTRLHHRTANSWQCHFRFGSQAGDVAKPSLVSQVADGR
jgi:SAM-dependent methyltransferase